MCSMLRVPLDVLTSVCAQQFTGVLDNVQIYISTICIVNFEGIINKYSDNKLMFFSHLTTILTNNKK